MAKDGMAGRGIRICPECGKPYTGHPALSRKDSMTQICADCGTRQALASIGVDAKEQEKILASIHRNMVKSGE